MSTDTPVIDDQNSPFVPLKLRVGSILGNMEQIFKLTYQDEANPRAVFTCKRGQYALRCDPDSSGLLLMDMDDQGRLPITSDLSFLIALYVAKETRNKHDDPHSQPE